MLVTELERPRSKAYLAQREALNILTTYDYYKGYYYYYNYVDYIKSKAEGDIIEHIFKVESERSRKKYNVSYKMDFDGHILSGECDCPQYKSTQSCKHIAAAICKSYDELTERYKREPDVSLITNELFDFFKSEKKNKVKKEVELELGFNYYSNYDEFNYDIYLKVGFKSKYVCRSRKLLNLLDSIKNNKELKLGKNFTLNMDEMYFNDRDMEVINYLSSLIYQDSYLNITESSIKKLIEICDNLYIDKVKINEIKNDFPISSFLKKVEGNYIVDFSVKNEVQAVTHDFEYVFDHNNLYHLSKRERDLLKVMTYNNIHELLFKESDFSNFSSSVLPMIKKNLKVDESIENLVINVKPRAKIYFDIFNDVISANIKLDYSGREINYFDNVSDVIRDDEYEDELVNLLIKNHFSLNNKSILLEGLDNIVDFLEEGINSFTDKYEVYTSEKLKQTNIVKKSNVKATFSIGKDNILSYEFDLGNINKNEINSLLGALRSDKRYYRLKSGDIIDLSDKDLQEFDELSSDLDLTGKDISSLNGEIPKYKAIYLDSLKKDKYNIIKTNNLFDELILKFNKYKDKKIYLGKEDKDILRDYQVDGVKWLVNVASSGFGGILADEMGLGKSIQTIYFFKELLKKNKKYKFLIVAPTSLAYNWEKEFNKFGSGISYKVLAGNKAKRMEEKKDISKTNVLITTYGLLREDLDFYSSIDFEVMVIDEAQNIKNTNTKVTKAVKSVHANTKIALTGTPIENSVNELWSIFDYMMPGYLGNLKNFQGRYKIDNFDEDADKRIKLLTRQINPFILRRRKKDVIKDLPEKLENNIFIDLNDEQKKIYLAELDRVQKATEEAMREGGMKKVAFMILSLLTTLRQICIHPNLVYKKYKGKSSKIKAFCDVVKNSVQNGHKILVFTSFRSALELARENLTKEGISSYVIDGSVSSKKRMDLVEKFNNNDTNVFFIMLKAGGTGLNLTGADVVIHLDLWWNPQAENQATDRAHRIGQKNTVEVIKIICKGTIEEKILELQNKKKLLSDKLIDSSSGKNSFSKLTEEDIKHLLSFENEK